MEAALVALWMGLFCSARSDPSGGAHSRLLAKVSIWGSTELAPRRGRKEPQWLSAQCEAAATWTGQWHSGPRTGLHLMAGVTGPGGVRAAAFGAGSLGWQPACTRSVERPVPWRKPPRPVCPKPQMQTPPTCSLALRRECSKPYSVLVPEQ